MKTRIFILLALLCGTLAVQAQGKNSLRVGVNAAFWETCDMTGAVVYAEYERELTSFMAVVPRISIGSANKQNQWVNTLLSSRTVSASLRFRPFPWKVFDRLKLDVGFLYQHTATSDIGYSSDPSYLATSLDYRTDDLFGLLFAVNINVLQIGRHRLGLRGEMLTSFGESFMCDGMQCGIYYGVSF